MEKLEESKSSLEDSVITSLENAEELQEEIQEKTQFYSQKEKNLLLLLNQLQEELETIRKSISEKEREREKIIASLSQEIVSTYEELRRKFPDPVTYLSGETCEGCNLTVPLAAVKAVRKGEELVRCPNCGRFLNRK